MEITPEIVRELLHYDPETGVFTWRKRDRCWFNADQPWKTWNSRFAELRAGQVWTSPDTGYQCRRIRILGQARAEHRIAWLYMTDKPLPPQIDHENRDGTDNRWCNLRASNFTENHRNISMSSRNTSGITGVYWNKERGKWQANCKINDKTKYLGRFDDLDDAARAVATFRAANGFDPGHGMEIAHYRAP
ncbi:HNH endonuclease [Billgrantia azerbaijanica]|nr:HNH endonuclease [Halomonas azerbaijanica]